MDSDRFRRVLGHFPTGVAAITAMPAAGSPAGMAVGTFTSVSLDPPLVAFLPDRSSSSWPKIRAAGSFCVNILGAEQESVCRAFAVKGGDKFADLVWTPAGSGAPILDGVVAWVDCDIDIVYEAGDHDIVIGRVRDLDVADPSLPLLFFQGGYGRFAPLSFAVWEGDLVTQLRVVDLAREQMERVAADLDVECVATALAGDEMVLMANAGRPASTEVPTRAGQRIPFTPPLGSVFVAWGPEEAQRHWVERAGLDATEDECAELVHTLEAVRRRGYSVAQGHEWHRQVDRLLEKGTGSGEKRLVEPATPAVQQRIHRLVRSLRPDFESPELTEDDDHEVGTVSVPVFAPDGSVVLVLSVGNLPLRSRTTDIEAYAARLRQAADAVASALGT